MKPVKATDAPIEGLEVSACEVPTDEPDPTGRSNGVARVVPRELASREALSAAIDEVLTVAVRSVGTLASRLDEGELRERRGRWG